MLQLWIFATFRQFTPAFTSIFVLTLVYTLRITFTSTSVCASICTPIFVSLFSSINALRTHSRNRIDFRWLLVCHGLPLDMLRLFDFQSVMSHFIECLILYLFCTNNRFKRFRVLRQAEIIDRYWRLLYFCFQILKFFFLEYINYFLWTLRLTLMTNSAIDWLTTEGVHLDLNYLLSRHDVIF